MEPCVFCQHIQYDIVDKKKIIQYSNKLLYTNFRCLRGGKDIMEGGTGHNCSAQTVSVSSSVKRYVVVSLLQ